MSVNRQVLRMYDVGGKFLSRSMWRFFSRSKSMYVDGSACVRVKGMRVSCLG